VTWNLFSQIADIQRTVHTINAKADKLMSQQNELDADVAGLQADLTALSANFAAELAALQAAVANGQPVNLDGLTAIKTQFDQLAASTAPPAA
jgi:peptidoglycan hydrolase CwlO-like protein